MGPICCWVWRGRNRTAARLPCRPQGEYSVLSFIPLRCCEYVPHPIAISHALPRCLCKRQCCSLVVGNIILQRGFGLSLSWDTPERRLWYGLSTVSSPQAGVPWLQDTRSGPPCYMQLCVCGTVHELRQTQHGAKHHSEVSAESDPN